MDLTDKVPKSIRPPFLVMPSLSVYLRHHEKLGQLKVVREAARTASRLMYRELRSVLRHGGPRWGQSEFPCTVLENLSFSLGSHPSTCTCARYFRNKILEIIEELREALIVAFRVPHSKRTQRWLQPTVRRI